jgi:ankyrin repeat protein
VHPFSDDSAGPLGCAVSQGMYEVCEALLQKGAPINAPDGHGQTPLFLAAAGLNVRITELLIAHGANVHTATKLRAILSSGITIRLLNANC